LTQGSPFKNWTGDLQETGSGRERTTWGVEAGRLEDEEPDGEEPSGVLKLEDWKMKSLMERNHVGC